MQPIIIYPPTIDWDYLHQRPQQLLKALAKLGCRCIFCNINLHSRRPQGIAALNENLWLANDLPFAEVLAWSRRTFPGAPLLAYFTYPPQIRQILASHPDFILFDSVDEPVGEFLNWQDGYESALRRADIVTATARTLIDRAAAYGCEATYLPNGCEYTHFASAQFRQPVDSPIMNTLRPIIGYAGSIAPWLDYKLINQLGRILPTHEIVLIGPMLLKRGLGLASRNLHYLGAVPYGDLPRYISRFSYCLIPFQITEMTRGVNPVKYWEYLASGIPLLSTPLPEVSLDCAAILPAELPSDWYPPADSPAARLHRIEIAQANDWSARAQLLYQIILNKISQG